MLNFSGHSSLLKFYRKSAGGTLADSINMRRVQNYPALYFQNVGLLLKPQAELPLLVREMLLAKRAVFSPNGRAAVFLFKQTNSQIIGPMNFSIISKTSQAEEFQTSSFPYQFKRSVHVTRVNRDLEAGLRSLGAGVAATGVIGSGIGLGLIFGNLLAALARNPSIANQAFANAIMGAAFCESLGLFAMAIAFVVMA